MIDLFKKKHRIYHMASMARSGETLLLKILSVHPDVTIVHNLDKEDNIDKEKSFQFLKTYEPHLIKSSNPLFKHYKLKKGQILLLKQGVWKHPYPFNGFILSRNPISIYSSLKSYDKDIQGYNEVNNFWFGNTQRLIRWLQDIDSRVVEKILNKPPVEQFVDFYNIRMGNLLNSGNPIVRYEDLLTNTEEVLANVCDYLGIQMNELLLKSHEFYNKGLEGHGKNDLSKPIDKSSLVKYKRNVTEEEFNFIKENTYKVYLEYGYKIESGKIIF